MPKMIRANVIRNLAMFPRLKVLGNIINIERPTFKKKTCTILQCRKRGKEKIRGSCEIVHVSLLKNALFILSEMSVYEI